MTRLAFVALVFFLVVLPSRAQTCEDALPDTLAQTIETTNVDTTQGDTFLWCRHVTSGREWTVQRTSGGWLVACGTRMRPVPGCIEEWVQMTDSLSVDTTSHN